MNDPQATLELHYPHSVYSSLDVIPPRPLAEIGLAHKAVIEKALGRQADTQTIVSSRRVLGCLMFIMSQPQQSGGQLYLFVSGDGTEPLRLQSLRVEEAELKVVTIPTQFSIADGQKVL